MLEICWLDIDSGKEGFLLISRNIGTPKVYRNSMTYALDRTYGRMLSESEPFTPVAGDSSVAGKPLLQIFADLANITGFYFGVSMDRIPDNVKQHIPACESRDLIGVVDYNGRKIVFPKRFEELPFA